MGKRKKIREQYKQHEQAKLQRRREKMLNNYYMVYEVIGSIWEGEEMEVLDRVTGQEGAE